MNNNEIYIVKTSKSTVDNYFKKRFPGLEVIKQEYIYKIDNLSYRLIECSSTDISGVKLFRLKKVITYEMCLEDAKKYKTLPEWRIGDKTTFYKSYQQEWMDKIIEETGLPRKKHRGELTYSKILAIAKQFKSLEEWIEKDQSAYKIARTKGFLLKLKKELSYETINLNLTVYGTPRTKNVYTYEECLNEAKKYTRIVDWSKASQKTYGRASREGWIDKIVKEAGIERERKKQDYYLILEDAKTFKTNSEWKNARKTEYGWIYVNGLLDKLKDEAGFKKINELFTFEECVEDATQFNNISQWRKGGKTFRCAETNDWLDEIAERVGYTKSQKKLWWYDLNN